MSACSRIQLVFVTNRRRWMDTCCARYRPSLIATSAKLGRGGGETHGGPLLSSARWLWWPARGWRQESCARAVLSLRPSAVGWRLADGRCFGDRTKRRAENHLAHAAWLAAAELPPRRSLQMGDWRAHAPARGCQDTRRAGMVRRCAVAAGHTSARRTSPGRQGHDVCSSAGSWISPCQHRVRGIQGRVRFAPARLSDRLPGCVLDVAGTACA